MYFDDAYVCVAFFLIKILCIPYVLTIEVGLGFGNVPGTFDIKEVNHELDSGCQRDLGLNNNFLKSIVLVELFQIQHGYDRDNTQQ